MVQVFGVGVLLTGESGVGKTSAAIELLRRGHVLVADDAVQIFQRGANIFGKAPDGTRSLVHIRGIGITNVVHAFRRATILNECKLDISIAIGGVNEESLGVLFFRIGIGSPDFIADRVESIAREYAEMQ